MTTKQVAVVIGIILGLIPFFFLAVLECYRYQLNHPRIEQRIKNLYQDICLWRSDYTLWYVPIFLFRRIIFFAIPTFLHDYPYGQLQTLLFMTNLYLTYYSGVRPHTSFNRYRLEFFNEAVIMLMNYHLIVYSRFNLNQWSKYIMGYNQIGLVIVCIVINIGLMLSNSYRSYIWQQRMLSELRVKIKNMHALKLQAIKQKKHEQFIKKRAKRLTLYDYPAVSKEHKIDFDGRTSPTLSMQSSLKGDKEMDSKLLIQPKVKELNTFSPKKAPVKMRSMKMDTINEELEQSSIMEDSF